MKTSVRVIKAILLTLFMIGLALGTLALFTVVLEILASLLGSFLPMLGYGVVAVILYAAVKSNYEYLKEQEGKERADRGGDDDLSGPDGVSQAGVPKGV